MGQQDWRLGKIVATATAAFIHPIAWPGWLIERIIRTRHPRWEFNVYTATPYLIALAIAGTSGLLSDRYIFIAAGLYVLSAMEMLALWICLAIALGKSGDTLLWLTAFSKRLRRPVRGQVTINPTAFYGGLFSFGFTTYYFACLAFFLEWLQPSSYLGLKNEAALRRLWDFFYFSAVTIATVGYGDIAPIGFVAQLLVVCEIALGIFFIVFLFGTFTSYRVGQLYPPDKNHNP